LPRFTLVTSVSATQSSVPRIGPMHRNLYHHPLQTPIFCIVSNWINGIYNTPDTGCLECYRPHASVNTTTPRIDRKHIHCRNMPDIRTRYIPWK